MIYFEMFRPKIMVCGFSRQVSVSQHHLKDSKNFKWNLSDDVMHSVQEKSIVNSGFYRFCRVPPAPRNNFFIFDILSTYSARKLCRKTYLDFFRKGYKGFQSPSRCLFFSNYMMKLNFSRQSQNSITVGPAFTVLSLRLNDELCCITKQ